MYNKFMCYCKNNDCIIISFSLHFYLRLVLLGVNGISIVTHGSSTSKAMMNSILLAQKSINRNLIQDISIGIGEHLGALS